MLEVDHIKEVQFPAWLSNVVMVPKATDGSKVCIDFRDLNQACPKDCYPLPRIDQMVDSTTRKMGYNDGIYHHYMSESRRNMIIMMGIYRHGTVVTAPEGKGN